MSKDHLKRSGQFILKAEISRPRTYFNSKYVSKHVEIPVDFRQETLIKQSYIWNRSGQSQILCTIFTIIKLVKTYPEEQCSSLRHDYNTYLLIVFHELLETKNGQIVVRTQGLKSAHVQYTISCLLELFEIVRKN